MVAMGAIDVRTWEDHVAEAQAALDAAARVVAHLQAHVGALASAGEDSPAIAMQANRSARIVEALVADAQVKLRTARHFSGRS